MNRYRLTKAGIDVNQGIRRLNENKELYESLLIKFLDDKQYPLLCQAIEAQDVKAAFAAAHALKGMAGNLSLVRLHERLIPLVEELRAGNIEDLEGMIHAVMLAYDEAKNAIASEAARQ